MENCRECGKPLAPDLAWCGSCLTPREEVKPVYGRMSMTRPDPPPLRAWEVSTRGYGPALRVTITLVVILQFAYLVVFESLLYGLWWLVPVPLLWDVWTRHRRDH